MENIFFNDEVLLAEKKIISNLRIPSAILMENAGAGSAEYIIKNFKLNSSSEIIIFTGKGNNAGDGFVTARHLSANGIKVKIITLFREKELKGDALSNFIILKNLTDEKINIIFCNDVKDIKKEIVIDNEIIIDAIFGVGFSGTPDERLNEIFGYINKLKNRTVISLDCPSGLYSYKQKTLSVKADVTLFMGMKKFHSLFQKGKETSGKTELISTGIHSNEFTPYNLRKIFRLEKSDAKVILPSRKPNSNKYTNGKVFIIAGSSGYTGAAYLCSMAALRSGSGAVITAIPESLNEIMEIKTTEVMTFPVSETDRKTFSMKSYDQIKGKLKWADSVLIGPGISKNDETLELVRKIVKENDLNFVIDGDAISAFKDNLKLLKNRRIIITPHFGEFSDVTGCSSEDVSNNFYELASDFAKEYKIILLLKNSPTIITDGNEFYINSTGKENLATAGTGDVLSGIIAGLFSQSKNLKDSALAGVYIHGMCGDNLYSRNGNDSAIAGDLIGEIAEVKQELRRV